MPNNLLKCIEINGNNKTVRSDNLAELIAELGFNQNDTIAIALNLDVVPLTKYSETRISPEDKIEIVSPMNGG